MGHTQSAKSYSSLSSLLEMLGELCTFWDQVGSMKRDVYK